VIREQFDTNPATDQLYFPGTVVPAGLYRRVSTDKLVYLDSEGYLPASLDGRVACYKRVPPSWKEGVQSRLDGQPAQSTPLSA